MAPAARLSAATTVVACLACFAAACGGASGARDTFVFAGPTTATDGHDAAPAWLDALPGPLECIALDPCASTVADVLTEAGLQPLVLAEPVTDARVITDGDDARVYVRIDEWSAGPIDQVVSLHYADPDLGPVAFVGSEAPFPLQYLTGDDWWGALERTLYPAFADSSLPTDEVAPYLAAARDTLAAFGGDPARPLETIDALLDALPRRGDDEADYLPIATLLAAGLVLGEEIRTHHTRLEWVPGDESMARFFALRDRHDPERLFRPIDFIVQVYRTPVPAPASAYAELVDVRLDDGRRGATE